MAVKYADINQAVLRNIRNNSFVLDVGCGIGILGEELKKSKNCSVHGIELSEESARIAKKKIGKVSILNIEAEKFMTSESFDVMIFADILEHLRNPEKALATYKNYLNDNGIIIISLPNIANWTIRFKLLFGSFNYTETGILDETHLRFFTIKSAKRLLNNCGLEVIKTDITPNFIRCFLPIIRKIFGFGGNEGDENIINSKHYKIYAKFILPIETFIAKSWKSMFAYQIVFVCTKK